MLFEQAAYLYIEAKTEGRKPVRPNTLEGYLSAIKCHLMPRWCGVEIEAINVDQLQAWVDDFDKPDRERGYGKLFVPISAPLAVF